MDNRVVKAANVLAKHPHEVVRRVIVSCRSMPAYANIYVINERGQRWVYMLKQGSVRPIARNSDYLSKDTVDTVFAGNMTIKEAYT